MNCFEIYGRGSLFLDNLIQSYQPYLLQLYDQEYNFGFWIKNLT